MHDLWCIVAGLPCLAGALGLALISITAWLREPIEPSAMELRVQEVIRGWESTRGAIERLEANRGAVSLPAGKPGALSLPTDEEG